MDLVTGSVRPAAEVWLYFNPLHLPFNVTAPNVVQSHYFLNECHQMLWVPLRPGVKMCPERTNHRWAAVSSGVNAHKTHGGHISDVITQKTLSGGLGHM